MGRPGPREAIEAELASAGCVLGEGAGGLRLMDCRDQRSRVRALDALAWHDARYDPAVRHVAAAIARGVRRDDRGRVDTTALAQALHRAVRERVAYLGEGAETFQTSRETWESGQGDCDDASRLLLALCRSVALPARLSVLSGGDDADGDLTPTHASVQIAPTGPESWTWAEPSLRGAAWGEEPRAAARRLRAGRGELAMGESEAGGCEVAAWWLWGGPIVAGAVAGAAIMRAGEEDPDLYTDRYIGGAIAGAAFAVPAVLLMALTKGWAVR